MVFETMFARACNGDGGPRETVRPAVVHGRVGC